jgi:hypothetical protein
MNDTLAHDPRIGEILEFGAERVDFGQELRLVTQTQRNPPETKWESWSPEFGELTVTL